MTKTVGHIAAEPYESWRARDQAEQDCFRLWTLADLVKDRYAIPSVPTVVLRRLYAQSQTAVGMDTTDAARETLQAVRLDIARTLEIRRRLDLLEQQSPKAPEPAQDDDQAPPALSDAERALQFVRALVALASQPPGRDQDGGTRVPVPVRPTRPTPPAGNADPIF